MFLSAATFIYIKHYIYFDLQNFKGILKFSIPSMSVVKTIMSFEF